MNFSPMVLAASAETSTATGGSPLVSMLITFLPILVIFYFFLIRPQKKREKEEKALRDSLAIGDEIVTIGGIIGIVVRQNDDTLVIETGGDRSKIRIQRAAVRENITAREKAKAASESKSSSASVLSTSPEVSDEKKKTDKTEKKSKSEKKSKETE